MLIFVSYEMSIWLTTAMLMQFPLGILIVFTGTF